MQEKKHKHRPKNVTRQFSACFCFLFATATSHFLLLLLRALACNIFFVSSSYRRTHRHNFYVHHSFFASLHLTLSLSHSILSKTKNSPVFFCSLRAGTFTSALTTTTKTILFFFLHSKNFTYTNTLIRHLSFLFCLFFVFNFVCTRVRAAFLAQLFLILFKQKRKFLRSPLSLIESCQLLVNLCKFLRRFSTLFYSISCLFACVSRASDRRARVPHILDRPPDRFVFLLTLFFSLFFLLRDAHAIYVR